jgi:hypothetical protein
MSAQRLAAAAKETVVHTVSAAMAPVSSSPGAEHDSSVGIDKGAPPNEFNGLEKMRLKLVTDSYPTCCGTLFMAVPEFVRSGVRSLNNPAQNRQPQQQEPVNSCSFLRYITGIRIP